MDILTKARRAKAKADNVALAPAETAMMARLRAGERITTGPDTGGGLRRDGDGWSVVTRIEAAMRAAGYEPRRQVLCAADYGTPQLRYRLFLVGFRHPAALAAWRWPAPSHADAPNLFGLLPWVTVRQALGLGVGAFASGRATDAKGWQGVRKVDVDRPGYCIGTKGNADLLDRPVHTIGAGGTQTGGFEVLANADYRAALGEALAEAGLLDRPSTTIDGPHSQIPKAGHHVHQLQGAVRLTPEQCAILQGFPPEFVFTGLKGSCGRQAGNAVPPQLAEAIGRGLHHALRLDQVTRRMPRTASACSAIVGPASSGSITSLTLLPSRLGRSTTSSPNAP